MKAFVDPAIERYCATKSSPVSEHCSAIEAYTNANVEAPYMMVGALEGSLLGFLVSVVKARRILEIGGFTGYSALAMAERLPEDGEIITLELEAQRTDIAKGFWSKSPHGRKIKAMNGAALDHLPAFAEASFDFIFIDADKQSYPAYFAHAKRLLAAGGLIAIDNCLWSGRVLAPEAEQDEESRILASLNSAIANDPSLEKVCLPVRDGIFLVQKR